MKTFNRFLLSVILTCAGCVYCTVLQVYAGWYYVRQMSGEIAWYIPRDAPLYSASNDDSFGGVLPMIFIYLFLLLGCFFTRTSQHETTEHAQPKVITWGYAILMVMLIVLPLCTYYFFNTEIEVGADSEFTHNVVDRYLLMAYEMFIQFVGFACFLFSVPYILYKLLKVCFAKKKYVKPGM